VDADDDEGEFDPLPDDDEDAVGREPRSAESSSHPANIAAGIQKKPAGLLKLRSSMPKWLKTNFYGKFLITVTVLLGFRLDFRGVALSYHPCQRPWTTADRNVTINRCMMTLEFVHNSTHNMYRKLPSCSRSSCRICKKRIMTRFNFSVLGGLLILLTIRVDPGLGLQAVAASIVQVEQPFGCGCHRVRSASSASRAVPCIHH
jgi:hypothetical protein